MVLRDEAFGGCLGHGSGALMNRIGALIKETLSLMPREVVVKRQPFVNQEAGPHQTLNLP